MTFRLKPMGVVRTIHAWVGALLSLILIIVGLTGAALVFKGDYLRATIPEAAAKVAPTPQALGAAADVIEHIHHGELRYLIFAGPNLGVHQAVFTENRTAYAAADGRIVTEWTGTGRPEVWLYELHHFLLAGDKGMRVVGLSGLVAVFLALTGLIVWAPWWKRTSLRVWPRSARRPDLIAAHRNIGLVFAIPIIVFCLTGSGLIFYQTTQALLVKWLPGAVPEEFFPPTDLGEIDWPKALTAAQAEFPDAQIRVALWPEGPWAPAVVRLKQPGEWTPDGRTTVLIDPSTSRVTGVVDPQKLGRGLRLNNALYPVHVAAVGGRIVDGITALSGLALAAMGALGLWAFVIKPRRRRTKIPTPQTNV